MRKLTISPASKFGCGSRSRSKVIAHAQHRAALDSMAPGRRHALEFVFAHTLICSVYAKMPTIKHCCPKICLWYIHRTIITAATTPPANPATSTVPCSHVSLPPPPVYQTFNLGIHEDLIIGMSIRLLIIYKQTQANSMNILKVNDALLTRNWQEYCYHRTKQLYTFIV